MAMSKTGSKIAVAKRLWGCVNKGQCMDKGFQCSGEIMSREEPAYCVLDGESVIWAEQTASPSKGLCVWPEHIEQVCELRDKCPVNTIVVAECPMFGCRASRRKR